MAADGRAAKADKKARIDARAAQRIWERKEGERQRAAAADGTSDSGEDGAY